MSSVEERLAALETLVTAGDVVSTASRLSALDARMTANETSQKQATGALEKQQQRADEVLTKRFEAGNEIREAMRDQTRGFVTRNEFQWALGAVILVLIGIIVNLLMR